MGILSHHVHIGIDIDETLASTFSLALDFYHGKGVLLTVPDFFHLTEHIFSDIPYAHLSLTDNNRIWAEFEEWPPTLKALPLPWAQDTVSWLADSRELFIITARVDTTKWRKNTEYWLKQYFPSIPQDRLYFTNSESMQRRPKSSVCKELWITCLIDDDIMNAIDVTNQEITCIMIEKPWNRNKSYTHPLLYRVQDWSEIRTFFIS